MANETGYRITITAWLPIDPNNIASLATAADFIKALQSPHMHETEDIEVAEAYRALGELSVKHRLTTRRRPAAAAKAAE